MAFRTPGGYFLLIINVKRPASISGCGAFCINSRRRPTFPHSYPCSIIGPEGLNFRVRDGNGCDPLGIATEKLLGVSVKVKSEGIILSRFMFHVHAK